MVFQWVKKMMTGRAPVSSRIGPPVGVAAARSAGLRYPPMDEGMALRSGSDILAANQDLLDRLRLHAATDAAIFDVRFVQPLRRLALHINILPGTSTGLFSGEMGLFRACAELGFYAFQASDGRIFTGQEQVERRHALEARWRYLCFLSGILFPLGRTLDSVIVTDPQGAVWKRHFHGLTAWAEQKGVQRVFASWGIQGEDDTELGPAPGTAALIPSIVGAENLQLLEDDSADLVASLYELAVGQIGDSRIAHQVIKGCWDRVLRREEARRPQAFGRLTSGTHQGPYLVGAIRAMVEDARWVLNKSPLRADQTGLYLQWPAAAADLIAWGRSKAYSGWPADAGTLAELLKAARVVDAGGGDLGLVQIVSDDGEIHMALKLANPLAVLTEFNPDDYITRRCQTLEAVLEADPVSQAEREAALTTEQVKQKRQPKSATQAEIADPPQPPPPAPCVEEQPQDHDATADENAKSAAPASTTDTGPLKEASEVRYADLLPDDIRASIGNALQAELLGKVVKAWRDRGVSSTTMRRVDNGAAITLVFLTTNMRDAPTWIDAMSKVGLIYAPAATPGMRIHKVPIPEGKTPVQAVILTNMACRRLGL